MLLIRLGSVDLQVFAFLAPQIPEIRNLGSKLQIPFLFPHFSTFKCQTKGTNEKNSEPHFFHLFPI